MRVLNLTEEFGLNEGGINAVEDTDWTEQRAVRLRQAIIRMLPLYDEILQEKKSTSRWISVLHYFKSLSETRVMLDTGRDNPADPTTFQPPS
jgi:hypothetical protein